MKKEFQLYVALTHPEAKLPEYAHKSDGGLDVFLPTDIVIKPGETQAVSLGLKTQLSPMDLPFQAEIQVRPRSGLALRTSLRIANSPGTIDAGYRGDIKIIVENTGKRPIFLKKHEKIAQLVVCPIIKCQIVKVDEARLKPTERGSDGFGSTG